MKKLTALLLILTLALALCACGATPPPDTDDVPAPKVDTTAIRDSYDKASTYVVATFKPKGMVVSEQDEDDGAYLFKNWGKENIGNADFPAEIELDGETVTIGKTLVKDLADMGFEVSKGKETVEPNEITSVMLTKDNRTCILSTADTMSDKPVPIDDIPVGAVSAAYASYALPFTYSGLDSESTPADILDKLGSPNSSINLSSDAEGTIIELIYSRTVKEDDVSTDINLLIDLKYDVAKNNATMSSIDITSISYKSE